MTLIEVEELCRYWARHPPVHLLLGGFLRGSREAGRPSGGRPPRPTADVAAVLAELGPGFAGGDVHAGLPPAVLRFEELKKSAAIR